MKEQAAGGELADHQSDLRVRPGPGIFSGRV